MSSPATGILTIQSEFKMGEVALTSARVAVMCQFQVVWQQSCALVSLSLRTSCYCEFHCTWQAECVRNRKNRGNNKSQARRKALIVRLALWSLQLSVILCFYAFPFKGAVSDLVFWSATHKLLLLPDRYYWNRFCVCVCVWLWQS